MKKIMWLATGGTISCTDSPDGLIPAADTKQMMKMYESLGIDDVITEYRCIMNIDSTDISLNDMDNIASYADKAVNEGYDGIVITHGTDTMAYTAAYLHYALENIMIPVILTGSQRPFFQYGSDAPSNLCYSFKAASCGIPGVYILFDRTILYGSRATKLHTTDDNAFASPDVYAGRIEDDIIWNNGSSSPKGEYRRRNPVSKQVGIVKLSPVTSPAEVRAMSSLYPDGLVIEGFGCGNMPSRLLDAVQVLTSEGYRIILISQCPLGNAASDIYEVGTAAVKAGAVPADMTAETALAHLIFS